MDTENIGNVIINYKYYNGIDQYSDGLVEDKLLDACKNENESELLSSSSEWPILYHLARERENLLEWYDFGSNSSILEIGAGCGALTGILSKKAKKVTCVELSKRRSYINAYRHKSLNNIEIYVGNFMDIEESLGKYDYITLIGVLEYSAMYISKDGCENPYKELLKIAKKHLKENGKIIIAIENKMGLKYWNGCQEDHTGRQYSSLNDYSDSANNTIRTFSRQEICELLKDVNIDNFKFYYPLPDYKMPYMIYSDDYLPHCGEIRTFGKEYCYNRIYNFNSAIINDQICNDGMYPYFANSFLIVCGENFFDGGKVYVKYNVGRKNKFQLATEIIKNNEGGIYVEKRALSDAANDHIRRLCLNTEKLNELYDKDCIQFEYITQKDDSSATMPFIYGDTLEKKVYSYRHNYIKIIELINRFNDAIDLSNTGVDRITFKESQEFREVFGKSNIQRYEESMRLTNIDLIFSNIKLLNSKFSVYDSEWSFDFPIPIRYVKWRNVFSLYNIYKSYLKEQITESSFEEKCGFSKEEQEVYHSMEENFQSYVYEYDNYLDNYKKSSLMPTITFYY